MSVTLILADSTASVIESTSVPTLILQDSPATLTDGSENPSLSLVDSISSVTEESTNPSLTLEDTLMTLYENGSIIYMGLWNSTTNYTPGNVTSLTVGGDLYIAIANNYNQSPPNVTYWDLFLSSGGNQSITLSGDVTGSGTGTIVTTIGANVVSNSKLAQMLAYTIKGNDTGSTANAADLTATQITGMLNVFTSTLKGIVPSSGGGTTNFLRADGTWTAPSFSAPVTSVFSRTGAVAAQASDYAAYYGGLATANTWTQTNTFDLSLSIANGYGLTAPGGAALVTGPGGGTFGITAGSGGADTLHLGPTPGGNGAYWIIDTNLNATISSIQSGASTASSPTLILQGWNGSASVGTQFTQGYANFFIQPTGAGASGSIMISPSCSLNLITTQSGSASNSPLLVFYGWSGSAAETNYIYGSSTGALSTKNNILDNGSGGATFTGTVTAPLFSGSGTSLTGVGLLGSVNTWTANQTISNSVGANLTLTDTGGTSTIYNQLTINSNSTNGFSRVQWQTNNTASATHPQWGVQLSNANPTSILWYVYDGTNGPAVWSSSYNGGAPTFSTFKNTLDNGAGNATFVGTISVSSGTNLPLHLTTSTSGPWAIQLTRSDLSLTISVFNNGGSYPWYFDSGISTQGGISAVGTISASNFSGSSSGTNTGDQNLAPYALLSGAAFSGSISASNFSGSSSGTNTGDQNLAPYALLSGATFTGLVTNTGSYIREYYGASGNYSTVGTSAWGGPIWGMDTSWTGGVGAANWSPSGVYGIAWQRATSTNANANIGEGLYVYQNGVLEGGIGTSGIYSAHTIIAGGAISGSNLSGTNTGDQNLSGYALLSGATFTGTIFAPTFQISSSVVLKQDITPLEDTSILDKMNFYSYRLKANPDKLHFGLIAEELAEISSDLVGYDKDGKPFSINMLELIPLLAKRIETLTKEVAVLRAAK